MRTTKKTVRKYFKYTYEPWEMPALTANGTIGGGNYACAASTTYTGYAYYAFDNNTATGWYGNANGDWITFYSPVPIKVSSIYIDTVPYYGSNGFDIYGSNDNSTFTYLASGSIPINSSGTVDVNATSAYQYIRVTTTSVNVGRSGFDEIKINATQQTITPGTSSDYDFYIDVDEFRDVNIGNKHYVSA